MKPRALQGMSNRSGSILVWALIVSLSLLLFREGTLEIETDPNHGSFVFYERFPSKMIPPRPVDVWLPPDYEDDLSERYPVICMHDGQLVLNKKTSPFASFFWQPFDWYAGGKFF